MKIYNHILSTIEKKGAAYFILMDPDHDYKGKLDTFIKECEKAEVDAFLIGGSLMMSSNFEGLLSHIKSITDIPIIIFPGSESQVSSSADAILFLSVISGRNPENLIGKQIIAAPLIKKRGIEPLSTGYMIIESSTVTTVQYIDGSLPIPKNKPEIAAATALAAEYMGMKFIYLEAGSGAGSTVPDAMIQAVSSYCNLPIIVGGGIDNLKEVKNKVSKGAKVIVMGNYFQDENNWDMLKDFANAVHNKQHILV